MGPLNEPLYKNNTLTVVSLSPAGKELWATDILCNNKYIERVAAGDVALTEDGETVLVRWAAACTPPKMAHGKRVPRNDTFCPFDNTTRGNPYQSNDFSPDRLEALNAKTGKVVWSQDLRHFKKKQTYGEGITQQPGFHVAGDTIIAVSALGVLAINAKNGSKKWAITDLDDEDGSQTEALISKDMKTIFVSYFDTV
jgi:outer membrane protein assembly factor BamB